MSKSYVLTKLIEMGYGVEVANEFYTTLKNYNLSTIAESVVTKSLVVGVPVHESRYLLVADDNKFKKFWTDRSDLVKWMDDVLGDDYSKSVFIKRVMCYGKLDDVAKQAFKQEVEQFIKYVSEEN